MKTNTKCYECGKPMSEKIITHHYIESGLPNVYLEGISEFTCLACSFSFVDIADPVQLHIILALVISNKPGMLTGHEIRFLRKEIGMTGKKFAEFIGVSAVTMSRWENDSGDANKEKSSDRVIRLAFKIMMSERLQTIVSWLESQIEKSKVMSFNHKRFDVHTDAMRYISFPSSERRCDCQ